MCGRFTLQISAEMLAEIFSVPMPVGLPPRYNIAPTQPVLVVRTGEGRGRELTTAAWGLIPSWAKNPAIGPSLINARAETVSEKPSFRAALRHRRCIVPASGFYEWQQTGEKSKQPWYITSADGRPLAFAGLWEHWQAADGREIQTCAIITTSANELMQPIHERMPVMLHQEAFALWLNPAVANPLTLHHLYESYPAELLRAWPVSPFVNNSRHDAPECISPASVN